MPQQRGSIIEATRAIQSSQQVEVRQALPTL